MLCNAMYNIQKPNHDALFNFLNNFVFLQIWYAKIFHIAMAQHTNALHYNRNINTQNGFASQSYGIVIDAVLMIGF